MSSNGFLTDAVLFLVTADPPISETELQFLAKVREHAGNCC
jgi:hypothetical protein